MYSNNLSIYIPSVIYTTLIPIGNLIDNCEMIFVKKLIDNWGKGGFPDEPTSFSRSNYP